MIPVLLAMQAAGMVTDYVGVQNQLRLGKLGAQLEQAGIESNIQMTRLQTEDASLQAMRNLRKTLGSQAAIAAANGTRFSAGSTLESVRNFGEDDRTRRINQLAQEAELNAGGVFSRLHNNSANSKIKQDFIKRSIDKVPTSPDAYKSLLKGASGSGGNFGMTPFTG